MMLERKESSWLVVPERRILFVSYRLGWKAFGSYGDLW